MMVGTFVEKEIECICLNARNFCVHRIFCIGLTNEILAKIEPLKNLLYTVSNVSKMSTFTALNSVSNFFEYVRFRLSWEKVEI